MNRNALRNNLNDNSTVTLDSLKYFYEVPESVFPPIPIVLTYKNQKEDTGIEPDEYTRQRTKDNIDEY